MMIPGRLHERRKCDRVLTTKRVIGLFRLAHETEALRLKQPWRWRFRLEHHRSSEDLAAVRSHDLGWRDLASSLTEIQIRSATYVNTALRSVYAALGVIGKSRKQFTASRYHRVGLIANCGDFPRYANVMAIPECPPKRVAGKRVWNGI